MKNNSTHEDKDIQPNWRKLDAGMIAYIDSWLELPAENRATTPISLFVTTVPAPSKYAIRILKDLGINISKPERGVFTAHLSATEIIKLSRRKFVLSLKKSTQLQML